MWSAVAFHLLNGSVIGLHYRRLCLHRPSPYIGLHLHGTLNGGLWCHCSLHVRCVLSRQGGRMGSEMYGGLTQARPHAFCWQWRRGEDVAVSSHGNIFFPISFFFFHSQLKCLEKEPVRIFLFPLKLREIIAACNTSRLACVFSITIRSLSLPHFINRGGDDERACFTQ